MAKTVKKNIVQKKAPPHCPYCDVEVIAANQPLCQACQVTITYCPHCGHPLAKGEEKCSSCGY